MKRMKRLANPKGGYGSYNAAPSKAESPRPKRGTGKPKGGDGGYGATTEKPKGIFGSRKKR